MFQGFHKWSSVSSMNLAQETQVELAQQLYHASPQTYSGGPLFSSEKARSGQKTFLCTWEEQKHSPNLMGKVGLSWQEPWGGPGWAAQGVGTSRYWKCFTKVLLSLSQPWTKGKAKGWEPLAPPLNPCWTHRKASLFQYQQAGWGFSDQAGGDPVSFNPERWCLNWVCSLQLSLLDVSRRLWPR